MRAPWFLVSLFLTLAAAAYFYSRPSQTWLTPPTRGPASVERDPFIEIIPHAGICNEVRIHNHDAEELLWREKTRGGLKSGDDDWNEFKKNRLTRAGNSGITYRLLGSRIVGQSIFEGQQFGLTSNELVKFRETGVYGETQIFYETDPTLNFADPIAYSGIRQRILAAVLYVSGKRVANQIEIDCEYVSGDFDLGKLNFEENCYWIDKNSRGSNELPYCW